jgi:sphingomyelin phosphodiesterase 3
VHSQIRIADKKVTYVTNLHYQAYQGKDAVIYHQLSETLGALNAFRFKTKSIDDCIIFDAICGDFNFDNLSPGDKATQNHPIFHQYSDICSISTVFVTFNILHH